MLLTLSSRCAFVFVHGPSPGVKTLGTLVFKVLDECCFQCIFNLFSLSYSIEGISVSGRASRSYSEVTELFHPVTS